MALSTTAKDQLLRDLLAGTLTVGLTFRGRELRIGGYARQSFVPTMPQPVGEDARGVSNAEVMRFGPFDGMAMADGWDLRANDQVIASGPLASESEAPWRGEFIAHPGSIIVGIA